MCLLSEHASSSCNWSFLPAPLCSTALFTFCSSTLQISSCTKIKPKSLPHFPVVWATDHALHPSAPSLSFYDSALSWLDSLLVKCTFSPSWCKHQGSALDPSFSTLNSCSKIRVVSRNVSKISHLKNAGNYISNVTPFFPPHSLYSLGNPIPNHRQYLPYFLFSVFINNSTVFFVTAENCFRSFHEI